AELATRHPHAGGKYVYAREAFGPQAGFVVGWIEGLVYAVATAAIGVVSGEYAGRLIGVGGDTRWLGGAMVAMFTGINLLGVASGLYRLLNAAFLRVLPIDRIAVSNLVPGDVVVALFGARGGTLVAGLALLVVLASLNGNIFVTPRILFGLAREGLGPQSLAR